MTLLDIIAECPINDFISKQDPCKVAFSNDIFLLLDRIFKGESSEALHYLPYLEEIYKACNRTNIEIIKKLRNDKEQSILQYYENLGILLDSSLENHRTIFINQNKRVGNMMSLFNQPTKQKPPPTTLELQSEIQEIETKLSQCQLRIDILLTDLAKYSKKNEILEKEIRELRGIIDKPGIIDEISTQIGNIYQSFKNLLKPSKN